MTTLDNRPNTALLIVDVQNGVVEGTPERDTVVANVGSLVEKARQQQVPVVWVQHSDDGLPKGSEEWRIVPELSPDEAEPLIEKNYGDSFEDTSLENVLSDLRVGRLVVVGAQSDACIRSTLHGAFVRGYDTTLVSDAHTRTSPNGVRRRRNRLSRTRTSTGMIRPLRAGRRGRSRRRTSTSADQIRHRQQRRTSARKRGARAVRRAQAARADPPSFADTVRSA